MCEYFTNSCIYENPKNISSEIVFSSSLIIFTISHDGFKLIVKERRERRFYPWRLLAGTDRETEASRALQTFLPTRSNIFYYPIHLSLPLFKSVPPFKRSSQFRAPPPPTVPHQTFHAVEFYQGTPRAIIDLARRRGEDSILTCFGYKLWVGWSPRILKPICNKPQKYWKGSWKRKFIFSM